MGAATVADGTSVSCLLLSSSSSNGGLLGGGSKGTARQVVVLHATTIQKTRDTRTHINQLWKYSIGRAPTKEAKGTV